MRCLQLGYLDLELLLLSKSQNLFTANKRLEELSIGRLLRKKTNVVTGNTSVVGEWWTVTAKCYDTAGKLYGTKTATYKVK